MTFFDRWELVYEIEFEGGRNTVSRGNWTPNSTLKQAAHWENCCIFSVLKHTSISVLLCLKCHTFLMCRTGILFYHCWRKSVGLEIPHYEVVGFFFFFAFKDVSAFFVDMLGKMCQRLEAMWSKPHAIGCFRVCEGCLLIVHQRTLLLSFMYWPIITISWSWMIFLAEPIKSTGQVNQALE